MSHLFNCSVNDIKRQSNRNNRSSPYSRPSTKSDNVNQWKHDKYSGEKRHSLFGLSASTSTSNSPSTKLIVEGLHYEISKEELRELFERIGATQKVSIQFDRSGRSTGKATIIYEKESDAILAKEEFDGANAKGQPIKITFGSINLDNDSQKSSLSSRIASGSNSGNLLDRMGGGGSNMGNHKLKDLQPPINAPKGPSKQNNQTNQRKVSRASLPGRKNKAPAPTAESLDAELDAFMKTPK